MQVTKKELQSITDQAKTREVFDEILWYPTRRKHDSGFACRAVYGRNKEGIKEISQYCDDLSVKGGNPEYLSLIPQYQCDTYLSGVNRYHSHYKFSLEYVGSSVSFGLIPPSII